MDRQQLSALAHVDHPIAAPLSDSSVEHLLTRSVVRADDCLLDLGCGKGEWLVHAARQHPNIVADGVDVDAATITRARQRVSDAGLADRIELHLADAATFQPARKPDLVLCVGATHAFGGLLPALDAVRAHLPDAGSVLIGDGFWQARPTDATLAEGFAADEFADLATTVDQVTAAGWLPVYGHVSTEAEWDDYEWSWTGSLTRWALDNPGTDDAVQALRAAAEHRDGWLRGYRGVLGFVTLLLRRRP